MRELRALVERLASHHVGPRETAIRVALRDAHGNLQRASKTFGVTDRALQLRRAAMHPR